MLNKFCKKPLYEVTQTMARVAMGVEKAELVIRNAKLVNVCTAEIQEGIDVAIAQGRIALVGDAAHCIGENTKVIDAAGQYIAPGFMDAHIHVESSMISVGEYARAVVPHGTTGIFMDPHEICNVCGPEGVKAMINDAKRAPLKAMSNVPSCVPAVAGFEDTGSHIGPEEVREMMTWDGIMGLGEMMSFPNVLWAEPNIHGELAETLKADQVITGHYSVPDTGMGLNAYIASGVRCCHESTRAEDVLEKMRHGMYALMRYGSAWHDMPVIIKAVLDNHIDDRFACLISDDTHPDTLIQDGHLDHIVRCAIKEGLDPIKAIQYVTINPATCFRMDHEMGSIAPGKCADIVFFDDLNDIRITRTIIDGDVVAENGKMTVEIGKPNFPAHIYDTMHVGHPITADSFKIKAPDGKDTVSCLRAPSRDRHQGRWLPERFRLQEGRHGPDCGPRRPQPTGGRYQRRGYGSRRQHPDRMRRRPLRRGGRQGAGPGAPAHRGPYERPARGGDGGPGRQAQRRLAADGLRHQLPLYDHGSHPPGLPAGAAPHQPGPGGLPDLPVRGPVRGVNLKQMKSGFPIRSESRLFYRSNRLNWALFSGKSYIYSKHASGVARISFLSQIL